MTSLSNFTEEQRWLHPIYNDSRVLSDFVPCDANHPILVEFKDDLYTLSALQFDCRGAGELKLAMRLTVSGIHTKEGANIVALGSLLKFSVTVMMTDEALQ